MNQTYDVAIAGAGIVGMSVAMQLVKKNPKLKIVVVEKENRVAAHQTGHNSGVIHSGIYYKPGSLKALNCARGIKLLHDFCNKMNVSYETTGKLIVATQKEELPRLYDLYKRGQENGLKDLKIIEKDEIKDYEPHVTALKAIWIPITGIIDFTKVVEAYAKEFISNGGEIIFSSKIYGAKIAPTDITLLTSRGEIHSRKLINCAGLHSDRIARLCGLRPKLKIVPFRGEYYKLAPETHHLVKNLIYPVPNPEFPFLGVHFTREISGEREVGPNAVLALKREGYKKTDISITDSFETFSFPAFWLMGMKYWRMGMKEMYLSFNKAAYVKEVQKMIPEIKSRDLTPAPAGVRAQALGSDGKLLDDFQIISTENMIHVLNAPSPAATASLAIGEKILETFTVNS